EGKWEEASDQYKVWIKNNTNSSSLPRAEFSLAWAQFKQGLETNAFIAFTNFVARYTNDDLAPYAQTWIADHYNRADDFSNAERSYEQVFKLWPNSLLAFEARMNAGRMAFQLANYSDATNYFGSLAINTNCDLDLRLEAEFARAEVLKMSPL